MLLSDCSENLDHINFPLPIKKNEKKIKGREEKGKMKNFPIFLFNNYIMILVIILITGKNDYVSFYMYLLHRKIIGKLYCNFYRWATDPLMNTLCPFSYWSAGVILTDL